MNKKNPNKLVYKISGSLTLIVIAFIIYATTFSSDAVNNSNGVSESGWEGLIVTVMFTPIAAILAVITFFTWRKSKQVEKQNTAAALQNTPTAPQATEKSPTEPPKVDPSNLTK